MNDIIYEERITELERKSELLEKLINLTNDKTKIIVEMINDIWKAIEILKGGNRK